MLEISTPTTQPTILLADNDPTTLETLYGYLKEEGNNVIPTPNLEATETMLKLNGNVLDAVILDGRLERESDSKDRSGWDLAKRTLQNDPNLVVIVHSRVAPKDSPLANQQPEGIPRVIEIPKSDLPALNRTLKEEIGKKQEMKQQRSSQEMLPAEEPSGTVATPIWSKQHKALVGLIALLLALICGLAAVLLGQPKFLVAAVVCALVAFVFVSLTLE